LRALSAKSDWLSPDHGPSSLARGVGGRGAHVVVRTETLPRISIGRKHTGTPHPDARLDELLDIVQQQTL
jgi:hypothetical protein